MYAKSPSPAHLTVYESGKGQYRSEDALTLATQDISTESSLNTADKQRSSDEYRFNIDSLPTEIIVKNIDDRVKMFRHQNCGLWDVVGQMREVANRRFYELEHWVEEGYTGLSKVGRNFRNYINVVKRTHDQIRWNSILELCHTLNTDDYRTLFAKIFHKSSPLCLYSQIDTKFGCHSLEQDKQRVLSVVQSACFMADYLSRITGSAMIDPELILKTAKNVLDVAKFCTLEADALVRASNSSESFLVRYFSKGDIKQLSKNSGFCIEVHGIYELIANKYRKIEEFYSVNQKDQWIAQSVKQKLHNLTAGELINEIDILTRDIGVLEKGVNVLINTSGISSSGDFYLDWDSHRGSALTGLPLNKLGRSMVQLTNNAEQNIDQLKKAALASLAHNADNGARFCCNATQ